MKYLFKLALFLVHSLLLIYLSEASLTNTTEFYLNKTGLRLNYQSFSGYEDIDLYYPKSRASIYYSLWQGNYLSWEDKAVPLIIWVQESLGLSNQYGCFN